MKDYNLYYIDDSQYTDQEREEILQDRRDAGIDIYCDAHDELLSFCTICNGSP